MNNNNNWVDRIKEVCSMEDIVIKDIYFDGIISYLQNEQDMDIEDLNDTYMIETFLKGFELGQSLYLEINLGLA